MEFDSEIQWDQHSQTELESNPHQLAIAAIFFIDLYFSLANIKNDNGLVDLNKLVIQKSTAKYRQAPQQFMFYFLFLVKNTYEDIIQKELNNPSKMQQDILQNQDIKDNKSKLIDNKSQNNQVQIQDQNILTNNSKFSIKNSAFIDNKVKEEPLQNNTNNNNSRNIDNLKSQNSTGNNFNKNNKISLNKQLQSNFFDNIYKTPQVNHKISKKQQQIQEKFKQMQFLEQEQSNEQNKQPGRFNYLDQIKKNESNFQSKDNFFNSKATKNDSIQNLEMLLAKKAADNPKQDLDEILKQNQILNHNMQSIMKEHIFIKSQLQKSTHQILNLENQVEWYKSKERNHLQNEKHLPDKVYEEYSNYQQNMLQQKKNQPIDLNYQYGVQLNNNNQTNNMSPIISQKPINDIDTYLNLRKQSQKSHFNINKIYEENQAHTSRAPKQSHSIYEQQNQKNQIKSDISNQVYETYKQLIMERYKNNNNNVSNNNIKDNVKLGGNTQIIKQQQFQINTNPRQQSYSLHQEPTFIRNKVPIKDNLYYQ